MAPALKRIKLVIRRDSQKSTATSDIVDGMDVGAHEALSSNSDIGCTSNRSDPDLVPEHTSDDTRRRKLPKKGEPLQEIRGDDEVDRGDEDNRHDEDIHSPSEVVDNEEGADEQVILAPYKPMKDTFKYKSGIAENKPPKATLEAIFNDLADVCTTQPSFRSMIDHLNKEPIRIATMCSGSECPIIALEYFLDLFQSRGYTFNFEHVFSAEIVPFKQSYILRNWPDILLFQDVVEIAKAVSNRGELNGKATTAWGSREHVPMDIDMLIAGSCCVDFSRLNNHRKTIAEGGESGDTLVAIVDYVSAAKPKFVILENVMSAPWFDRKPKAKSGKSSAKRKSTEVADEDKGIITLFQERGYFSRLLKLDTKEFALPQTRERGYLLAIHEEAVSNEWMNELGVWEETVAKFKSNPSVSAETMILAMADHHVSRLRTAVNDKEYDGEKPWEKCRVRHRRMRQDLKLGELHPVTKWSASGYRKFPSFWRITDGTTRVFDVFEISHLTNARRGFDDMFYSRTRDLSQSADRDKDVRAGGIIGCQTPRGMTFISAFGRKLRGEESLTLQGIPIDRIDLSTLNNSQMQDLTGNSMTSTVVGSVMMAVFLTFFKQFRSGDGAHQISYKAVNSIRDLPEQMQSIYHADIACSNHPINVHTALIYAEVTVKLCSCEASDENLPKTFYKCQICGYTVCKDCAGDPEHTFGKLIIARKHPAEFVRDLKQHLPKECAFQLSPGFAARLKSLLSKATPYIPWYRKAVSSAFQSKVHWNTEKRSDIWEVIYQGPRAKLVLQVYLSKPRKVQWLLYALPCNDSAKEQRDYLNKYPIARMKPTNQLFTFEQWEIWLPKTKELYAKLKWSGNLLPSWRCGLGLVEHSKTFVFDTCDITLPRAEDREAGRALLSVDIAGTYQLKQKCGQAMRTLHISRSEASLFFYLDHEKQSGDFRKHSFVLTDSTRAVGYGVSRQYLARFYDDFGQPEFEAIETCQGSKYKLARLNRNSSTHDPLNDVDYDQQYQSLQDFSTYANIIIDGQWSTSEVTFRRHTSEVEYRQMKIDALVTQDYQNQCGSQITALSCKRCLTTDEANICKHYGDILVDCHNAKSFYDCNLAFLMDGLKSFSDIEHSQTWVRIAYNFDVHCVNCSPAYPKMIWGTEEKTKNKILFEHPREATLFQKAMKQRPAPISVTFHIDKDDSTRTFTKTVRIGIDPMTLGHRAAGLLKTSVRGSVLEVKPVSHTKNIGVSWQFVVEDAPPNMPDLSLFSFIATRDLKMASQNLVHLLHPEQRRCVEFMMRQEENPPSFYEKEFDEADIPQLRIRLLAKAEWLMKVPGGLIASQTGFGKTPAIISLVQHRQHADQFHQHTQRSATIHSRATLIVVPKQLVQQWVNEIMRFCTNTPHILIIRILADLREMRLEEIRDANYIVISADVFDDKDYCKYLAHFAGVLVPDDKTSQRSKEYWLGTAHERIAQNIDVWKQDPSRFLAYIQTQLNAGFGIANQSDVPVLSRRLNGSKYQLAKKKAAEKTVSENNTENTASKEEPEQQAANESKEGDELLTFCYSAEDNDWQKYSSGIILEMFCFARIVIDEFQYLTAQALGITSRIKCHSKWLLSATPGLTDYHAVQRVAFMLGIYLGRTDYNSLTKEDYASQMSQMTSGEQIHALHSPFSLLWLKLRHEHAQDLLKFYARQDNADKTDISSVEHIVLVQQTAAERTLYLELEVALTQNEFLIPHLLRDKSHRATQLRALFKNYAFASESQIFAAGFYNNVDTNMLELNDEARALTVLHQNRKIGLHEVFERFKHELRRVEWLEHQPGFANAVYYKSFKASIDAGTLDVKDGDILSLIRRSISQAAAEYRQEHWEEFYASPGINPAARFSKKRYPEVELREGGTSANQYLRGVVSQLATICQDLAKYYRYLMIARNVKITHDLEIAHQKPLVECQKCEVSIQHAVDVMISMVCGHLFCKGCYSESSRECNMKDCNAEKNECHAVNGSEFKFPERNTYEQYGSKINAVVQLLQDICKREEKTLLFVQNRDHIRHLQQALEEANIEFLDMINDRNPSAVLTQFQRGMKGQKVLFLNIGDSSASGANLAVANNIIFFSPYLTRGSNGQSKYDAAMEQAKGRAIRWGQNKTVNIYHVLTALTIDVDLFEFRTGTKVQSSDTGTTLVNAIAVQRQPDDTEKTPFSSHVSALQTF